MELPSELVHGADSEILELGFPDELSAQLPGVAAPTAAGLPGPE